MKLRKKASRERRPSGDDGGSGRRRKLGKKDADEVWYHNVSPIFEAPISDDFLGLVSAPEGEERPYEEPSVQVTVERNLPPIAPLEERVPEADPYGPADGPMAEADRYTGASSEGLGGAYEHPPEAAPGDFGAMPAPDPWAETGFVGGSLAGSLDAPPWAMEPPGVPEAAPPPPSLEAPPWAMEPPGVPEAAPPTWTEAPPEPAVREPERSVPPEAPPEPAPWQPGPSFQAEPPPPAAEPPVPQRPFVHDSGSPPAVDPPMIIPIRAYYMTRADDTLRSVAAQFLNTPSRWQELRSLNAAYPGIANAGPDTLLPVGSSLALPGDPLPWGKPDPVYLWTLAEKFLYTAWGREPSPEEVVPFWRGLTSGAKHLDMGASAPSAIGAPAPAEPPIPPAMQPPAAAVPAPPVAPPVAPPLEAAVAPPAPGAPAPPPAPPAASPQQTWPEEGPPAEPFEDYEPEPPGAPPPAQSCAEACAELPGTADALSRRFGPTSPSLCRPSRRAMRPTRPTRPGLKPTAGFLRASWLRTSPPESPQPAYEQPAPPSPPESPQARLRAAGSAVTS